MNLTDIMLFGKTIVGGGSGGGYAIWNFNETHQEMDGMYKFSDLTPTAEEIDGGEVFLIANGTYMRGTIKATEVSQDGVSMVFLSSDDFDGGSDFAMVVDKTVAAGLLGDESLAGIWLMANAMSYIFLGW